MTDFPGDLPFMIFYRAGNVPLGFAFPRRPGAQAVPRGATEWRENLGGWRPVAELPGHWLPWLTRDALSVPKDAPLSAWECLYHKAVSRGWTFRQLAFFYREQTGRWPGRSWPLMPLDPLDAVRLVREVPAGRLHPKEKQ